MSAPIRLHLAVRDEIAVDIVHALARGIGVHANFEVGRIRVRGALRRDQTTNGDPGSLDRMTVRPPFRNRRSYDRAPIRAEIRAQLATSANEGRRIGARCYHLRIRHLPKSVLAGGGTVERKD